MNYIDAISKKQKLLRVLWNVVWFLFARPFPCASLRLWKVFLVNLFGGHVDRSAIIYASVKIYMPWNLYMDSNSCVASGVELYNVAPIRIGKNAIISQNSFICTASHDIRNSQFKLISKEIIIEESSWVASKCFISPGVIIGEWAVVGATSSVYKDVKPYSVVGGNPAKIINVRKIKNEG